MKHKKKNNNNHNNHNKNITYRHLLSISHVFNENLSPDDILSDGNKRNEIKNMIVELSNHVDTLVLFPMQLQNFVTEEFLKPKSAPNALFVRYMDFVNQDVILKDVFTTVVFLSYPNYPINDLVRVAPQFFQTEMFAFKTDMHYEKRRIGNSNFQINVKVYSDNKMQTLVEYLREELIKDAMIHAINSFDKVKTMFLVMDIPIPKMNVSQVIRLDQVVDVSNYIENNFDELKNLNHQEDLF